MDERADGNLHACGAKQVLNTYHAIGSFSRQQTDNSFLFFLENRIWHFMQIVSLEDTLHEVSNPIFS